MHSGAEPSDGSTLYCSSDMLSIEETICRLEQCSIEPDPDYSTDDDDEPPAVTPTGSHYVFSPQPQKQVIVSPQPLRNNYSSYCETEQKQKTYDEKKTGPFDFMRKLRGSGSSSSESSSSEKRRISSRQKTLGRLKVDSLPQSFVVKYIGCKPCRGLWGIQHTRDPVDSLIEDLQQSHIANVNDPTYEDHDLPLVRIDVTSSGIAISVHPRNRSQRPVLFVGLLPLEFISYAVQDTRYSRIFAFVLVSELSSRGRATECHAFLCDQSTTARRLALSVALAFGAYEQKLAGQPFQFTVDLRWPDELESELNQSRQQQQQQRGNGAERSRYPRAEFEV